MINEPRSIFVLHLMFFLLRSEMLADIKPQLLGILQGKETNSCQPLQLFICTLKIPYT